MFTLGSGSISLGPLRHLSRAVDEVSQVTERLGSGLRINKAADDAAGLAVSSILNLESRILGMASRNIGDGLSLLAIADSALGNLHDIVIRQKELAAQSANGTYSAKQRAALDKEGLALTQEYDRILKSTTFNGRAVFDLSYSDTHIQVTGDSSGMITLGLGTELGRTVGDGTFQTRVGYGGTGGSFFSLKVTTDDINGDGDLDLIGSNETGACIWTGNGDGSFRVGKLIGLTSTSDGHDGPHIQDLNNDSHKDLIFTNGAVLIANGDGTFRVDATHNVITSWRSESELVDVNQDAILDLVVSSPSHSYFSVLLGNSNGTFRAAVTHNTPNNTNTFVADDFNEDGIVDLLSGYSSTGTMLLGNGDGTFRQGGTSFTDTNSFSFKSGDVDGDGHTDAIVAGYNSHTVAILKGNGNGTFLAPRTYQIRSNELAGDVAVADVNGDNILDLVTAQAAPTSAVGVMIGNGDGTFKADITYGAMSYTYGVALGDFNEDGALDIASADPNDHQVGIYIGNTRETLVSGFTSFVQQSSSMSLDVLEDMQGHLLMELGKIGALQKRLEVAFNQVSLHRLQVTQASSRIVDADIAEEAARLVAANVGIDAAKSVLAAANQSPRRVLDLLL